jgi:hypothetical protein
MSSTDASTEPSAFRVGPGPVDIGEFLSAASPRLRWGKVGEAKFLVGGLQSQSLTYRSPRLTVGGRVLRLLPFRFRLTSHAQSRPPSHTSCRKFQSSRTRALAHRFASSGRNVDAPGGLPTSRRRGPPRPSRPPVDFSRGLGRAQGHRSRRAAWSTWLPTTEISWPVATWIAIIRSRCASSPAIQTSAFIRARAPLPRDSCARSSCAGKSWVPCDPLPCDYFRAKTRGCQA